MKYFVILVVGVLFGLLAQMAITGFLGDDAPPRSDVRGTPLADETELDGVLPSPPDNGARGEPSDIAPTPETASPTATVPSSAPLVEGEEATDAEPWLRDIADGLPVYEPQPGDGWLAGRVTEAGARPIAGAVVTANPRRDSGSLLPRETPRDRVRRAIDVERWNAAYTYSAVTDAEGYYRIEGIPEDWRYDLRAKADDYDFDRGPDSSRHYRVAANHRYDFVGAPTVRLRLTVLLANGEPAPQFHLCLVRGGTTIGYGSFSSPVDTTVRYEPGFEVCAELISTRVRSSTIAIPATDERPIPPIEGTLRFSGPGGLMVHLEYEHSTAYSGMPLATVLTRLEAGEPASAETLMAEGRSRGARELRSMGRDSYQTTMSYAEVEEGRYLLAVVGTWPVMCPVAMTEVVVPPGNAEQIDVTLAVPPPSASDLLVVRFMPPDADLPASVIRVRCEARDANQEVRRTASEMQVCRSDEGQWHLFVGRSRLTDGVASLSVQFFLQDLGFTNSVVQIATTDLAQGMEVPLVRPTPFTIRVHNVPSGLSPRGIRVWIYPPEGQNFPAQESEDGWQVTTLPPGRYTVTVHVNNSPILAQEIEVTCADQAFALDLPPLYTLTVLFPDQGATRASAELQTEDRMARYRARADVRNDRAVFEYLPAGRYDVHRLTQGVLAHSMMVDVLGDTTVTFVAPE